MTELRQSSTGGIALLKQNQSLISLLGLSAHITYLIDSLTETYNSSQGTQEELWLSFQVVLLDAIPVLCSEMSQERLFLSVEMFSGSPLLR